MRCRTLALALLAVLIGRAVSAQETPAEADLQPGVSFKLYHVGQPLDRIYLIDEQQRPHVHRVLPTINLFESRDFGPFDDRFIVRIDGWIKVPAAGQYRFRITSDDGCRLAIDGEVIAESDLEQSPTALTARVELEAGLHPLRIDMFENQGGQMLTLEWRTPDSRLYGVVPAGNLFVEKGLGLDTADPTEPAKMRGIEQRPGSVRPLEAVHPGWSLEQARPEGFEPQVGGLAFLPDGKLAITSFQPMNNGVLREDYDGTLYILDNATSTDTSKMTVHVVTDELYEPLGLNWHDGALYVADRNEVSKWTDSDGDGYPDQRASFASGWISDNYHNFTFGLPYHDGYFYASLSTSLGLSREERRSLRGPLIAGNAPNPPYRGSVMQINAQTGEVQYIAGGLRTPNGLGVGPGGVVLVNDNQGDWKPASGIYAVHDGAFFGKYNNTEATTAFYPEGGSPSLFSEHEPSPPAVYLPQNEIANSPGEMVLIPDGLPYAGQLLMAEVALGGLRRVFLEEVDGTWQGAVFRHSQGFEAGLNRLAWGPDGCLYCGGMGQGAGNWGWRNTRFGLQRMRPTGQTVFEFEKIQATADGFRVSFTKPVPKDKLEDLDAWIIDTWTYEATPNYGGPKLELHSVRPTAAAASADRMSVELAIPDREPNDVYHIRTDPTSDDGDRMWSPEAWVTFHKAPAN